MRKKGTKNKNYRAEFKISVIMDMRKNHLGHCETVRKYGLGSTQSGGAINTLHKADLERNLWINVLKKI